MKIYNKIRWVLFSVACLVLCAVILGFSFASAQQEYQFELDSKLNSKYAIGQTIEIPTAVYAEKEADFVVQLPDGNFSNDKLLTLTQYGEYKVIYSAKNPDTNRIEKQTLSFVSTGDYITVNGTGYSEYRKLTSGVEGIYARLNPGDSLVFNDIVDLNQLGAKDLLFNMCFLPDVAGDKSVNTFEIKIIDVYDQNNYINIRVKLYDDSHYYSFKSAQIDAQYTDSVYCGLHPDNNGKYTYNNFTKTQNYRAIINHSKYGSPATMSMTGGTATAPHNGKHTYGFSYDEQTGILYSCAFGYYDVVTDFNNLNIYGKAFKGFTTGEVKIQITPTLFMQGNCGMFFTGFKGIKFNEENYNAFSVTSKPTIDVDLGEYTENNLPKARQGVDYKIFDAKALSVVSGEVPVDVKVYYAYDNLNKVRVNVVDGKFKATNVGTYTIVYTASDKFGNKSEKTLSVDSVASDGEIPFTVAGEIDYEKTYACGQQIKVLEEAVLSSDFGKTTLKVFARLKTDESIIYQLNEENGYTFTPLYSGEYDIVFDVSDYTVSKSIVKNLKVDASEVIVYQTTSFISKYVVSKGCYDFDVIKAYSLASGSPVEVPLELKMFSDSALDGEIVQANNVYISANSKVKLSYAPKGIDFDAQPYEINLTVKRTGLGTPNMLMKNYLITEQGEFTFNSKSAWIECEISEKVEDKASFSFANVLAGHSFFVSFAPLYNAQGEYQHFDSINCYLKDATNPENYVKATLKYLNNMWFVSVNDSDDVKIYDTWGLEDDTFLISFDSQKNQVVFDDLARISDVTFYGQEKIATFRRGLYFTMEIVAKENCSGIKLKQINNQVLSQLQFDIVPSIIDMTHDFNAGEKKIGQTITLEPFFGYDVLTPNLKTYVSVVLIKEGVTSTQYQTSVDGVLLKNADASRGYEFVLSDYGTYNVQVRVTDPDNTENNSSRSYSIVVNDYQKPVVTITNKVTSGKVNSSVKLATFTTEKPLSELNYCFTVLDTDGYINYVDGDSFTPTKAGKYIVTLVVVDAKKNMSQTSYEVVVK